MTASCRLVLRDRTLDGSTQQPRPVSDGGPGTQQVGRQHAPGPERPILSADRSPAAWIERFHLGSEQKKARTKCSLRWNEAEQERVQLRSQLKCVAVESTVKGQDERPSDALDSTLHRSTMLSR